MQNLPGRSGWFKAMLLSCSNTRRRRFLRSFTCLSRFTWMADALTVCCRLQIAYGRIPTMFSLSLSAPVPVFDASPTAAAAAVSRRRSHLALFSRCHIWLVWVLGARDNDDQLILGILPAAAAAKSKLLGALPHDIVIQVRTQKH